MKNITSMLPELFSAITVTRASVPAALEGATARGVLWSAAAGRFLLELPGVARYLVEGGSKVTIEADRNAAEAAVAYFLGMTPLAALQYQLGRVVFHAAAAADERGAVLLAGDSGVGKSVLLTALLQRGWRMLADDLAVVAVDEQGGLQVQSTHPQIALWPDAVRKLGIAPASLEHCDTNRYAFNPPGRCAAVPLPLRAIYWLNVHNKAVQLLPLVEKDSFRTVGSFLYNSHLADALMDRGAYLRCVASIARSVPVHNLLRPRTDWCVDELAELVAA